jgi:hypothetical protein
MSKSPRVKRSEVVPEVKAAGPEPQAVAPFTPNDRKLGNPAGIAIRLGDGQEWIVARLGLARGMGEIRESIYASWSIDQVVRYEDVMATLWYGLEVNYALEPEEIRELLDCTDFHAVAAQAAEAALPWPSVRRTFTDWARAALMSNGLNPADVPAVDLPHVLDALVATGRAPDPAEWTDAGRAAAKFGGLKSLASRLAPAKPSPLLATE